MSVHSVSMGDWYWFPSQIPKSTDAQVPYIKWQGINICIYAFFVAVIANDTFKIKRFLFLLIFYKFHLWKMNIGKISSNKENCPPNLKKYTISHHYTLLLLFSGQSCLTLCDPMDYSTPGHPAPHHLPEFAQVLVHCIGDGIQPSHPLTPSSSALNLS